MVLGMRVNMLRMMNWNFSYGDRGKEYCQLEC